MELITLEDAWKEILSTDPALWAGVLAVTIVFVIEIVLVTKGIIFSTGEKRLERVRGAGHIISATRIKCRYKDKDESGKTANHMYVATYEYCVNEEKKN